ncbi:MAG TPA: PqiC family protein [Thermoanaerobaculia bacterium]
MKRAAVVVCCLLLAGCGLFKRTPNTFYTLDTIPGTPRSASGAPLGIDALELPPGLDRRGLVVRGADLKLDVRGQHQWSAALEDMVIHTLAFDLASRLPEGMVVLPGQPKPANMRSLAVVMEELAPGQDRVFVLDARWTLAGVTRHERITVPMPSLDSPEIPKAMSAALAELAQRIAAGA